MKYLLFTTMLFCSILLSGQTSIKTEPVKKETITNQTQVKTFDAPNNMELMRIINEFLKTPNLKLELMSYAIIRNVDMPGGESRSVIIAYHIESK